MNKNLLTFLGCSSSLALALLNNNPAQANTPVDLTFMAPNISQRDVDEITKPRNNPIDCGCSNLNSNLVPSDQLGDLAISQWGCDCAGCRNITLSRIQEGQLSLPLVKK